MSKKKKKKIVVLCSYCGKSINECMHNEPMPCKACHWPLDKFGDCANCETTL